MSEKGKGAPAPTNPLKNLVSDAVTQAEQAPKRADIGTVKAGPFKVGETGNVSVVEKTIGQSDKSYLYAAYTPTQGGKVQRIPLAAVAVLAEQMA